MTSEKRKIQEAQEHIRQAEKSLRTGVLKWKPEYDIACEEYQKAATCYKNAKELDDSRHCLMKAASCHMENRSLFYAARCFEQVIIIFKEQNNLSEIEKLAHRVCGLYQQQGIPEAGARALERAAKIVESKLPESALNLYQHAIEVVTIEDSLHQAAEYASKVSRITVKLGRYDQAVNAVLREIGICQQNKNFQAIGRLVVALVLVQLARGDLVAAQKAFNEWGNYCDFNEVQTLHVLLQAFDEQDPDMAKQALSSPFIKHMDIDYARLARDLPLPKAIDSFPRSNAKSNRANEGIQTIDADLEQEGALC